MARPIDYAMRQSESQIALAARTLITPMLAYVLQEIVMNTIKVSIAAGLLAMALSPSFAAARDASAPHEVTVRYDELNMASDSAATALYSRLRSASRQVCAPFQGRELRHRAAFKACYAQALSNAVVQVNRTAVTALHSRATKGVTAS